jgi:hypothetical protein
MWKFWIKSWNLLCRKITIWGNDCLATLLCLSLLPFNENMAHNMLALIMDPIIYWIMQNLFFIGLYGIDTDLIHLFVLFEHQCHAHCLNTYDICLFILFRHKCYMFIYLCFLHMKVMHTTSMFNDAWYSCLSNTNLWNNIFWQIWNKPMKLISLWWMVESWVKDMG